MKSSQTYEQLIVFTRYPEPGRTKTRLATALGDRGAAEIQRVLTEHTAARIRDLRKARNLALTIYYAGGDEQKMKEWLGADFTYRPQVSGGLGERLIRACSDAFGKGYKRVVIIGSDCPDLEASHLKQAFEALYHKDLVLGPAADGGYYLIGMSREVKEVFTEIPWSTKGVMAATLNIAEKLGLTFETLTTLNDVDRPEDLKHINHYSGI
ncbi:MAG: TIGR04282 family arsenosugar biosynthesis glycosyltransferase [Deltaproteobacteria bacterium]|jgi:rSAM/selenodomain-associated transferase 1|nr:TIGR04282 family arsenosugar biosynthesis glycosyltransferase [Deltaproteobacteria bacterium]